MALPWSSRSRKQIQGLQRQAQRLKSVSTGLFQNLPEEGWQAAMGVFNPGPHSFFVNMELASQS